MAAMFWVMVWHGRRRQAANAERARVSEENERLLATQRRFLQDASHQLRTPITIALGHSELLARHLADNQDKRDINVVVGELNRLRLLSERLLLIAASANPDFLQPEPVELDEFITDVLWRWRPTADRRWQLGQLDEAAVLADRRAARAGRRRAPGKRRPAHQPGRHHQAVGRQGRTGRTGPGSSSRTPGRGSASRAGRTSSSASRPAPQTGDGRRGTGLGLALVRAVAEGHGGAVAALERARARAAASSSRCRCRRPGATGQRAPLTDSDPLRSSR